MSRRGTATAAGKLVVVPSVVEAGQTTLAVSFHVDPMDLEVVIEYSEHFTPEGDACDTAGTVGATQAAVAPTWVTLNACTVGEGYVRLVDSATGNVIKNVSVTVDPPGAPRQQAVSVTIDGLDSGELVPGGSGDRFSVSVTGLEAHREHNLFTVVLNSTSAAFNRGCTTFRESHSIVGLTSSTVNYTVYGCVARSALIWSWVEDVGGTSLDSTGVLDNPVDIADPKVSFGDDEYSVDEEDEDGVTVTVELSHPSSNNIEIPIDFAGTAERTDDYVVEGLSSDDTLTFSDLSTSEEFTIVPNDDDDFVNETVNLSFGTLPSTVMGTESPSSATVTIEDPGPLEASFDDFEYSVDEGDDVTVTVNLSRASSEDIDIPVTVSRDRAESGDYDVRGLTNGTLTIEADETSASFTIDAGEDSDRDDETLDLDFGSLPSGVDEGATSSATVTILDDEIVLVSFEESSYSVDEAHYIGIKVELNGRKSRELDIPIEISGDADSDYYDVDGLIDDILTIPAWHEDETFWIDTYEDDNLVDNTVELEFGRLPSGVGRVSPSSADVTILEPAGISFGESAYSVVEGGDVTVTVELSRASSQRLDIPITVSRVTAESTDYEVTGLTNGRLRFEAGDTSKTFDIETNVDADVLDERVDLRFGALPDGVVAGTPSTSTVTIEEQITASFGESSYSIVEGEDLTVTVELSRASGQRLDIPVTVSRGTAESTDYDVTGLTNGRLRFEAGDTSKTFDIETDVDVGLFDETLNLRFGTLPDGVVAGTPSTSTVTIEEQITASFGESSYSIVEGEDLTVTVELSRASGQRLDIPVTVSRGTAESTDYDVTGLTNGRLRFEAGDTSKTFDIETDVDVDLFDETLNLRFGTLPDGVVAGTPSTATVTIEEQITASFGESSYSIVEGEDLIVTVELSRASGQRLDIPITVSRGTAEPGDYDVTGLTNGRLRFEAGDTSKTFDIETDVDSDLFDETLNLRFGTLPDGVVAGTPSTSTVTIEEQITASFGESSYSIVEGEDLTVTVELSRASGQRLDIPITVSRGTAEPGDYDVTGLTNGRLRFEAGDTSKTFEIETDVDSDLFDERLNLRFGTLPDGVVDGTPSTSAVTIEEMNVSPTFDEVGSPARTVAENTVSATAVGSPVTASDADDDDALTYSLSGSDAGAFRIGRISGQIRTFAPLNFESKDSYAVTVTADDGNGGTASIDVTINVNDVNEPPAKPSVPTVTTNGETSLNVSWSAPINTGPAINDYDVQYRVGDSGSFTSFAHTGTATQTTISGLDPDTAYEVQVRAKNPEGTSSWSDSGTGSTDAGPMPPPDAPTGLRANGHLDSDGNVKLRWDAVDGATGYNVRYAEEVCMQTDIDYDDNGTNEVLCDLGSPPLWTTIMEQDITTEELTINGATVLETSLNFTPPDPIRNPVIFNTLNILAFPSVPWPLYRVEVRAVVADSSEWSDFVLVFPTAEPPGVDARFATYHQNDHVDATNGSHEYGYTICKGTITTEVAWGWSTDVQGELVRDDDTVTAIAADIEAAIEKWETVVRWVTSGANIVSTTATVSETCPEDDAVQFIPDGEVEEFCTRSDALGCQPPNTFSMFLRHNPEMRESSGKIELTSWDAMSNGCSYLHKIVMHEAGHVFGLAHPQTPQAAMFRSTSGWQDSFCEPQIYDILAMMANYQSR